MTRAMAARRRWSILTPAGTAVALAAAVGAGYALTRVSVLFGDAAPVAFIGLVVAPVAGAVILAEPWVGAGMVIGSIPVGDTALPGVPLQVVEAAALVVATIVILRRLGEGATPFAWVTPMWWAAGLLVWVLVSTPSAADPGVAVRQATLHVLSALFGVVVLTVCPTPVQVRRVLAVFAGVAAYIGLSAPLHAGTLQAGFGGAVVEGRATGVFNQPNQLGSFCALALMIAVGLAFGSTTRRGRRAAVAAAAAIAVGLLVSLSRGAWIGVTLGVVVLTAMVPDARRRLIIGGVPLIVAGALLGAFAPSSPQVTVVGERVRSIFGERNPYDARPAIWAEAERQVVADPWTGQGPGAFPVVAARATSEAGTAYPDHAHNIFLTFAAEEGFPALLLLLAFIVHVGGAARSAARSLRRDGFRRESALLAGLVAAMVSVIGQGLVDYTLRAAVLYAATWGALGALLALLRWRRTGGPDRGPLAALPA